MPRKVRELIRLLTKAGFIAIPAKGSHRKFIHPHADSIVISGNLGDDAKRYQEELVKTGLQQAKSQGR